MVPICRWCCQNQLNKKCRKLFEKAQDNPNGLRFSELVDLCECFGMKCDRIKGSHFIFRLDDPFILLSIQKLRGGQAKPYQVRQLLNIIIEKDLKLME